MKVAHLKASLAHLLLLLLQEPQVSVSITKGCPFILTLFDREALEHLGVFIKKDLGLKFTVPALC